MSQSFLYRLPEIYIAGLKLYHGRNFSRRYCYIASLVSETDNVLEPGCGPAILADFLPKNIKYSGFDTNKKFLNYAKNKNYNVYFGNVLDKKNYKKSDIVVACDILHHLNPSSRKDFIKLCWQSSKKNFVICDPGKPEAEKKGFWQKLGEWSEQDDTNNFKNDYFLTKKQLLDQIKNGFGCIPGKIKRTVSFFGEDIVAVFYKDA